MLNDNVALVPTIGEVSGLRVADTPSLAAYSKSENWLPS